MQPPKVLYIQRANVAALDRDMPSAVGHGMFLVPLPRSFDRRRSQRPARMQTDQAPDCEPALNLKADPTSVDPAASRLDADGPTQEAFFDVADDLPALCWAAHGSGGIFWFSRRWYASIYS